LTELKSLTIIKLSDRIMKPEHVQYNKGKLLYDKVVMFIEIE